MTSMAVAADLEILRCEMSQLEPRVSVSAQDAGWRADSSTSTNGPSRVAEEDALIARAQGGDRVAFHQLYLRHADKIYQIGIAPLIRNEAQREDMLAETFLRALEHLSAFRQQGHGLLPWLLRIAKNLCLDHLRRRWVVSLPEDFEGTAADQDSEDVETLLSRVEAATQLSTEIEQCLAAINPRYAAAIRLRCIERCSRADSAAKMAVSIGTFDVLFFRACKSFRRAFASECAVDLPFLKGELNHG